MTDKEIRKAIITFEKAFCRYGEVIESDEWESKGPDAWVKLIVAMDELRKAFGVTGEYMQTRNGGFRWVTRWRKQ